MRGAVLADLVEFVYNVDHIQARCASGRIIMAESFQIAFEIPKLSLLSGMVAQENIGDQVELRVQKLTYQPGDTDLWHLPAAQAAVTGTLDVQGAIPVLRCAIPMPAPQEVALYRCTILKTGTALDAEGKVRDSKLHPTEEELLFFMVADANGQHTPRFVDNGIIPGVQCVVIPATGER
jgi:hypothetical protein